MADGITHGSANSSLCNFVSIAGTALIQLGLELGMISYEVIAPMRWWVRGLLVLGGTLIIGYMT